MKKDLNISLQLQSDIFNTISLHMEFISIIITLNYLH